MYMRVLIADAGEETVGHFFCMNFFFLGITTTI